ncbi:MAG: CCA tRNA nucleotidyltransferase [Actinobacteria bacterium]|jgi:poly(A) polymerase|nr:CCA tRNA nucleotidyltransferase [Micrococcales bacterium]MCB0904279.1 CCA tRNA nucleotidyltransferase [Actinomycetota bacterium]MCO5299962.1 CCA tRNA nucleotidyltransferase [Candidatus Nanopelagicales bacterium]HPE11943.1 CCA tRNA nucleotidyltransferase [Actinomycetota bacterium]HPJ19787.1 CCA tRNA nucleotidyltransferase [Actinomycetota bacterium]
MTRSATQMQVLHAARDAALEQLRRDRPVLDELGQMFAAAGHQVDLVGGSVRDAILGRGVEDLDFATDARPEQVIALVRPWADAVWDVGARFGTIGAESNGMRLEFTTYRSDRYDAQSRKPQVEYGADLLSDLGRRDFTVNAMAVRLPQWQFVDPFDGLLDLAVKRLRTPGAPADSFSDDPLRMMRAARLSSQLGMSVDAQAVDAMANMAERIDVVSAERVRDELVKLIMSPAPRPGLQLLVDTGLCQRFLPEVPALALEIDEHHRHKDVYEHSLTVLDQAIHLETAHEPAIAADFVLRFAALMHDVGKPKTRRLEPGGGVSFHHHEVVGAKITRKRMQALRFDSKTIDEVTKLVGLHLRFHGYGTGEWTDAAVRRYARDAGDQLLRLHKLTRADSTTRNRRKAAALQRTYDHLEQRISILAQAEELAAIRPDLDGNQIMSILGIGPGRDVGRAYNHLLELRMDNGPMSQQEATEALLAWWESQGS